MAHPVERVAEADRSAQLLADADRSTSETFEEAERARRIAAIYRERLMGRT